MISLVIKFNRPLLQRSFPRHPCCKRIKNGFTSFNQGHQQKKSFPRIEWFYIPAGVGFGLLCLIQLKHIWKREQRKIAYPDGVENPGFVFQQWQVDLLKNFPTRSLSRLWGYCCNANLPVWLRKPLINSYSWIFECNLEEAIITDVTKYPTFNKFFTRRLKPGVRSVDPHCTVVSPADATVLTFGSVSHPKLELEQIKGFTYPLNTFVGPRHPFLKGVNLSFPENNNIHTVGSCPSQVSQDGDFKLFYCTLYLGPGDYHWFHSPTEWTIEHRRHIPGHLFSVNPRSLRHINGIFNFNERVLLSGHWEHGLFLYAAIGAYNVGSIKLDLNMDKDLQTNSSFQSKTFKDRLYSSGILMKRGETLGRFELGSSLVLVFTAPKDFEFSVRTGDKLKYGQPLGHIASSSDQKIT